MSLTSFKVESGIQLLARLNRKPDIEKFYPVLFQDGPKSNEVIEIYSSGSSSCLLSDIIAEALITIKKNGSQGGVLIFNTDGNHNFDELLNCLRRKILLHYNIDSAEDVNNLLQATICNLNILEIYDVTQLYTSIHCLDRILAHNPNISLIVFDTLPAFYWSEQGFKITKMDVYVKYLLKIIQKITNEYKITILYTKPEYFSSSKDSIEKLEACCEQPTLERVNYRVQIVPINDGPNQVLIRTFNNLYQKTFQILDDGIQWL